MREGIDARSAGRCDCRRHGGGGGGGRIERIGTCPTTKSSRTGRRRRRRREVRSRDHSNGSGRVPSAAAVVRVFFGIRSGIGLDLLVRRRRRSSTRTIVDAQSPSAAARTPRPLQRRISFQSADVFFAVPSSSPPPATLTGPAGSTFIRVARIGSTPRTARDAPPPPRRRRGCWCIITTIPPRTPILLRRLVIRRNGRGTSTTAIREWRTGMRDCCH